MNKGELKEKEAPFFRPSYQKKRRRAYKRGLWAEWLAAWFLRAKGYRILARRFRCPFGEIDLIAQKGSYLVAIEVKRRSTRNEAMSVLKPRSLRRMERSLCFFLTQKGQTLSLNLRCDALIVTKWQIPLHLKNVTL